MLFFVIFGIDVAISNSMMWSELPFNSVWISCLNYERCSITKNTPMQYTAIFHGCKNENFQSISFDYFHFLAQNIDCGYTLEPPH